jgi:hypothetical protein
VNLVPQVSSFGTASSLVFSSPLPLFGLRSEALSHVRAIKVDVTGSYGDAEAPGAFHAHNRPRYGL